ncbi:hypothetical protein JTE90_020019 [Oedothorax gibbosus]|uniref:Uncharacterized protein n=1 Tax=Oedothorax gibbosus TaxID=931172 RepID=A0AAV6UMX8_9ARAC|nr:hypothetical protein JTE90_020019 [Oedothorax gibbosus]
MLKLTLFVLGLAATIYSHEVDVIHHHNHGHGSGVSARYFRKDHGYGLGSGIYGLGYGGLGLAYGGHRLAGYGDVGAYEHGIGYYGDHGAYEKGYGNYGKYEPANGRRDLGNRGFDLLGIEYDEYGRAYGIY